MANSLRKNSIMMVLYEILSLLIPLILTPYVSRTLGAEGVGVYSYSYSIVSYFVILVQLGVKLYGRREIAKINDDQHRYSIVFWEIFSIQSVMLIVASLSYAIFLYKFNTSNVLKFALIIQAIEILVGYLDISWLFYGIERFKVILYRNLIVRLFQVVLIFLFVKEVADVNIYVFIMAFCNLFGVIMMWTALRGIICRGKIVLSNVLSHALPLLTLFIPVISSQLFAIVDKTIIGAYLTMDDVGEYENAYKIAKIPVVVITAIGSVMLPRITKLLADNQDIEAKKYISKSMSIVMFASCGISFGMSSIASVFVPWFLGPDFEGAIPLFQLLSFMILFIGWGNVLRTQYMLPRGHDFLYTKSIIYGSIVNILLSFLFIKFLGAIGVAFASLLGEAIISVYSTLKMKKELQIGQLFRENIIYLLSGLLMFVVLKMMLKLFESYTDNIILILLCTISVGVLLYFILVVIFEIITKHKIVVRELTLMINKK